MTLSGQPAGSGIAGGVSREAIGYSYNLVPRSTLLNFTHNNIMIEFGNEVVGPTIESLPKYMRDLLPPLPYNDLNIPDVPVQARKLKNQSENEPYQVMQDMWYFRYAYDAWIAEKDKQFMELQSKYGKGFDKPVNSEAERAEQRDINALKYWSKWRDRYATKWIRLTVTSPDYYILFWWRDFNGKGCTVMERGKEIIMQPHLDLDDIIQVLSQDSGQ